MVKIAQFPAIHEGKKLYLLYFEIEIYLISIIILCVSHTQILQLH